MQWVIWWWQLACKEEWAPLWITKLGWSIKITSMQEEDWGRICVGSVISWWSQWDEETNSRSIPSLVETSPFHQEFDLRLKSPDISLDYSNSCQLYYLIKAWEKNFRSHLRIVMGNGRLQEHNPFYYLL